VPGLASFLCIKRLFSDVYQMPYPWMAAAKMVVLYASHFGTSQLKNPGHAQGKPTVERPHVSAALKSLASLQGA